jgi:hypothetical protein
MAKAEHERDRERDQQRRPVEEAGQPDVQVLDRLEQELEVECCGHVYLLVDGCLLVKVIAISQPSSGIAR